MKQKGYLVFHCACCRIEAKYTEFKYRDAGFSLERSEAYSLGEKINFQCMCT